MVFQFIYLLKFIIALSTSDVNFSLIILKYLKRKKGSSNKILIYLLMI